MQDNNWILVGLIHGAHGVRGLLRVESLSDNPTRFAPGSRLYAIQRPEAKRKRLEAERQKPAGRKQRPGVEKQGSEAARQEAEAARQRSEAARHSAAEAARHSVAEAARHSVAEAARQSAADYQPRVLIVESATPHRGKLLISFVDVKSREDAAALWGASLMAEPDASTLPEGQYYHYQLLGLSVYEQGRYLGRLIDILSRPANDVYIMQTETGEEVWIPALKSVVKRIDLAAGSMEVTIND